MSNNVIFMELKSLEHFLKVQDWCFSKGVIYPGGEFRGARKKTRPLSWQLGYDLDDNDLGFAPRYELNEEDRPKSITEGEWRMHVLKNSKTKQWEESRNKKKKF